LAKVLIFWQGSITEAIRDRDKIGNWETGIYIIIELFTQLSFITLGSEEEKEEEPDKI
jgi:hypothetical protein